MKFFPTVDDIAEMSPICSTIVASAIGTMVSTDVTSSLLSGAASIENTVFSNLNGSPTHGAFLISFIAATLKSLRLSYPFTAIYAPSAVVFPYTPARISATTTEPMIPIMIGMILIIPLP